MNRAKTLRQLAKEFYKFDCNIYDFCYYLGLTNVKENISNKDLEILLDKCEELRGEYTDPIEVGQSLANAIYEDKSIKINQLKNLDCEKFNDWYIDGREVGNELEIEMEREEMNVIFGYKTMPEWHKNNLKNYYILDGIYTVSPDISEEDAQFIFDICKDIKNEKVNPFSIAHYLTEHYLNGDIFKEELKKAASGEIISAVYYDDLNYLPLLNDRNEIEHL